MMTFGPAGGIVSDVVGGDGDVGTGTVENLDREC